MDGSDDAAVPASRAFVQQPGDLVLYHDDQPRESLENLVAKWPGRVSYLQPEENDAWATAFDGRRAEWIAEAEAVRGERSLYLGRDLPLTHLNPDQGPEFSGTIQGADRVHDDRSRCTFEKVGRSLIGARLDALGPRIAFELAREATYRQEPQGRVAGLCITASDDPYSSWTQVRPPVLGVFLSRKRVV